MIAIKWVLDDDNDDYQDAQNCLWRKIAKMRYVISYSPGNQPPL